MSGRILNFSEFSGKYSPENVTELGIDDFSNSSSNFEEAFDDETYDQPQIGPNRPVSGNYETAPNAPTSDSFNTEVSSGMEAPDNVTINNQESSNETEPTTDFETETDSSTETKDSNIEDKKEDKETVDTEEDEEEEDEHKEGNPEDGEVKESNYAIGYSQFLVENYDEFCEECGEPVEMCTCKTNRVIGCPVCMQEIDESNTCGCN